MSAHLVWHNYYRMDHFQSEKATPAVLTHTMQASLESAIAMPFIMFMSPISIFHWSGNTDVENNHITVSLMHTHRNTLLTFLPKHSPPHNYVLTIPIDSHRTHPDPTLRQLPARHWQANKCVTQLSHCLWGNRIHITTATIRKTLW